MEMGPLPGPDTRAEDGLAPDADPPTDAPIPSGESLSSSASAGAAPASPPATASIPAAAPARDEGAGHRARVLVNACVDFRFVAALVEWLHAQGLRDQYDLRTHEGASATVDQWLESEVVINRLHDVEAVWIVDHEDCGAYRLAGEANTRENHVLHLKAAQARVQAWVGKPVRIFYHPLGPDGRGAAAPEEIGP
ncbi:MAG TPA: carbonic anhydrase [Chloroflexota bacterium]